MAGENSSAVLSELSLVYLQIILSIVRLIGIDGIYTPDAGNASESVFS